MARVALPLTVVDTAGNAVQGASVTVRKRSDNSLATLYTSEAGGVTTGNPATTNTQGRLPYWIDRGAYAAAVTGTGITPYTENFEASPAKDAGVDTTWGSLVAGTYTNNVLASRPSTPASASDRYFASDDWGGTLYVGRADLSGWDRVASKNQITQDFAAAATVAFTGLSGDSEIAYAMDFFIDTSTNSNIQLQFNADANQAANYNSQQFFEQGVTLSGTALGATLVLCSQNGSVVANRYVGHATIGAKTGARRLLDSVFVVQGTALNSGKSTGYWTDTAAPVTAITLVPTAGTITGRVVLRRILVP